MRLSESGEFKRISIGGAIFAVIGVLSVGALVINAEVDPKQGFGWGEALVPILVGAGAGFVTGVIAGVLVYGKRWTPPANPVLRPSGRRRRHSLKNWPTGTRCRCRGLLLCLFVVPRIRLGNHGATLGK